MPDLQCFSLRVVMLLAGCWFMILAGCSGESAFVKPGYTDEDLQNAIALCQAQQTSSDLNRQMRDTMANPGMAGGGMTGGRMLERQESLEACLLSQGWKRR